MLRNKFSREITVGNPTCLLGFSGRESVDSGIFDTSTLAPSGVTEVQTVTISGTPTGGTFRLGYKGQVTANIAYNANAAAIQTALRALSRIGAVTVGGSGPFTVTFTGKNANKNVPVITLAANNLTGGTSPTVAVAETTKGDSTYAGLYVLRSGLPVMWGSGGKLLVEWDGASATTLVGIFDGFKELMGPDDYPSISVYNHNCVFDKDVVKNYATNSANFLTWAAAHASQFKSQGS